MSPTAASQATGAIAPGRYSKRKRSPVINVPEELAMPVSGYTTEVEAAAPAPKTFQTEAKAKVQAITRPPPNCNIFPFMELPAELRNMIYAYSLVDPAGIMLSAATKYYRRGTERVTAKLRYHKGKLYKKLRGTISRPYELSPALLAVSKQVYQEGHDILYGNEFIFEDTCALYAFLINLGPASTKHLRKIRVFHWGLAESTQVYNHACFATLVCPTNMTRFQIDGQIGWKQNGKNAARQMYRDAFPWLEAVGLAKGRVDAATDVLQFGKNARFGLQVQNRVIRLLKSKPPKPPVVVFCNFVIEIQCAGDTVRVR